MKRKIISLIIVCFIIGFYSNAFAEYDYFSDHDTPCEAIANMAKVVFEARLGKVSKQFMIELNKNAPLPLDQLSQKDQKRLSKTSRYIIDEAYKTKLSNSEKKNLILKYKFMKRIYNECSQRKIY